MVGASAVGASPASALTPCTTVISGQALTGPLVVPAGETCQLMNGTVVTGSVIVQSTGALIISDSTVRGSVTITGGTVAALPRAHIWNSIDARQPTYFEVSGARVDGSVIVRDRPVGAGSIFIEDFYGPRNQIGGNLAATNNRGTSSVDLLRNDIRGNLICSGNQTITHFGNNVGGSSLGQCAAP